MSAWIDANLSKPIFSLKYLPNLDEYITIYGMLGNLLKIFALGYTYLPEIKHSAFPVKSEILQFVK